MGDRVKVSRTLVLDLKDPCDPALEVQGLSVCFRPTNKETRTLGIHNRMRKNVDSEDRDNLNAGLKEVRNRIREAVKTGKHGGAKVLNRLLAMNDSQLLDELLNKSSKQKIITHVSVVPLVAYRFNQAPTLDLLNPNLKGLPQKGALRKRGAGITPISVGQFQPRVMTLTLPPVPVKPQGAIITPISVAQFQPRVMTLTLPPDPVKPQGPFIFHNKNTYNFKVVAGFTFSKSFGDKYEVQFARETWFTDRYYAYFKWNLTAGFGLRWPFKVTAKTEIDRVYRLGNQLTNYPARELCKEARNDVAKASQCAASAVVKIKANTITDATLEFYQDAGIPKDELFKGNEFVFTVGATCRLYASIPGKDIDLKCPAGLSGLDFSSNFSSQLGRGTSKTLLSYELSGRSVIPNLGIDVGIGYAVINPGVVLKAHSGKLKFALSTNRAQTDIKRVVLDESNTYKQFKVSEAVSDGLHTWGVELKDLVYNVSAKLVPTVSAEMGIDLYIATWSHKFGPFELDDLAINLGNHDFTRHSGTPESYVINIGQRLALSATVQRVCNLAEKQYVRLAENRKLTLKAYNSCTKKYRSARNKLEVDKSGKPIISVKNSKSLPSKKIIPGPKICPTEYRNYKNAAAAKKAASQRMSERGC